MLTERELMDSGILENYKLEFFLNKQYRNLEKNNEFLQFETNMPIKYISYLLYRIPIIGENEMFENGVGPSKVTQFYSENDFHFFESYISQELFAKGCEIKSLNTTYTFIKLKRDIQKNPLIFPKTRLKGVLKDLGLERIASKEDFVKVQDKYGLLL